MHSWILLSALGLMVGCAPADPPSNPDEDADKTAENCDCPTPSASSGTDTIPTRLSMRDVELILLDGVLRVRFLEGTVESLLVGRPPMIDDPKAYRIVVDRAEVAVDVRTLNGMMSAEHSASGRKTPLASADFSTEAGLLVVTGKKPVPFVFKGAMSVDAEGKLTISVVELKAMGVQTKGILKALDLKLEDLIDVSNERGVTVDQNVVHVDPLINMPAPEVDAKVTGVSVEADGLVLRLGEVGTTTPETPTSATAKSTAETAGSVKNYLSYAGGTVTQGKLTIQDAAITLVDLDPTDPLRLSIDAINKQIAAGYARITEDGGMTSFIPDADDLGGPASTPPSTDARAASRPAR